jgi:hypothetical protein
MPGGLRDLCHTVCSDDGGIKWKRDLLSMAPTKNAGGTIIVSRSAVSPEDGFRTSTFRKRRSWILVLHRGRTTTNVRACQQEEGLVVSICGEYIMELLLRVWACI